MYLTYPSAMQDMTQSQFFNKVKLVKEFSLTYYLPIAEEKTDGFMPSSRTLMQCKMQTTSSRIWTWTHFFQQSPLYQMCLQIYQGESPMVKWLITLPCDIVISKFKLQSCNYIHFQTGTLLKCMNPFNPPAMGLIVPLLFFYKDNLDIK